jgi:hypothetical protein
MNLARKSPIHSLCLALLVLGGLALTAATGRSQVILNINANSDFSVVTMSISGSYTLTDSLATTTNLSASIYLDGFTDFFGWEADAGSSTLQQVSGSTTINYNSIAWDDSHNSTGTFLEASSSLTNTNPHVFSGTATFDLSSIAEGLSGSLSGNLELETYIGDGDYDSLNIGTWNLTVAETPEPGTIALACAGLGLAAFALRRRRVAA